MFRTPWLLAFQSYTLPLHQQLNSLPPTFSYCKWHRQLTKLASATIPDTYYIRGYRSRKSLYGRESWTEFSSNDHAGNLSQTVADHTADASDCCLHIICIDQRRFETACRTVVLPTVVSIRSELINSDVSDCCFHTTCIDQRRLEIAYRRLSVIVSDHFRSYGSQASVAVET